MREPMLQSPLHPFALEKTARKMDESAGVWAREAPLLGYLNIRGDAADPAFNAACASVLGAPLPVSPCAMQRRGQDKLLWLAPDEWLLVCPRTERDARLTNLNKSLAAVRHQVVDNSGGFTQILLEGRHASNVLRHVTVYNIDALKPENVVGTTFGKSSVYLHREGSGFTILLRRSFADYIWRYLVRAAEPYGFAVAAADGDGR